MDSSLYKLTAFTGNTSMMHSVGASNLGNTNQLQTTLQLLLEAIEEQGRLKLVIEKLQKLLHDDSDMEVNLEMIENNINDNLNDKIKSMQSEMRRLVEQNIQSRSMVNSLKETNTQLENENKCFHDQIQELISTSEDYKSNFHRLEEENRELIMMNNAYKKQLLQFGNNFSGSRGDLGNSANLRASRRPPTHSMNYSQFGDNNGMLSSTEAMRHIQNLDLDEVEEYSAIDADLNSDGHDGDECQTIPLEEQLSENKVEHENKIEIDTHQVREEGFLSPPPPPPPAALLRNGNDSTLAESAPVPMTCFPPEYDKASRDSDYIHTVHAESDPLPSIVVEIDLNDNDGDSDERDRDYAPHMIQFRVICDVDAADLVVDCMKRFQLNPELYEPLLQYVQQTQQQLMNGHVVQGELIPPARDDDVDSYEPMPPLPDDDVDSYEPMPPLPDDDVDSYEPMPPLPDDDVDSYEPMPPLPDDDDVDSYEPMPPLPDDEAADGDAVDGVYSLNEEAEFDSESYSENAIPDDNSSDGGSVYVSDSDVYPNDHLMRSDRNEGTYRRNQNQEMGAQLGTSELYVPPPPPLPPDDDVREVTGQSAFVSNTSQFSDSDGYLSDTSDVLYSDSDVYSVGLHHEEDQFSKPPPPFPSDEEINSSVASAVRSPGNDDYLSDTSKVYCSDMDVYPVDRSQTHHVQRTPAAQSSKSNSRDMNVRGVTSQNEQYSQSLSRSEPLHSSQVPTSDSDSPFAFSISGSTTSTIPGTPANDSISNFYVSDYSTGSNAISNPNSLPNSSAKALEVSDLTTLPSSPNPSYHSSNSAAEPSSEEKCNQNISALLSNHGYIETSPPPIPLSPLVVKQMRPSPGSGVDTPKLMEKMFPSPTITVVHSPDMLSSDECSFPNADVSINATPYSLLQKDGMNSSVSPSKGYNDVYVSDSDSDDSLTVTSNYSYTSVHSKNSHSSPVFTVSKEEDEQLSDAAVTIGDVASFSAPYGDVLLCDARLSSENKIADDSANQIGLHEKTNAVPKHVGECGNGSEIYETNECRVVEEERQHCSNPLYVSKEAAQAVGLFSSIEEYHSYKNRCNKNELEIKLDPTTVAEGARLIKDDAEANSATSTPSELFSIADEYLDSCPDSVSSIHASNGESESNLEAASVEACRVDSIEDVVERDVISDIVPCEVGIPDIALSDRNSTGSAVDHAKTDNQTKNYFSFAIERFDTATDIVENQGKMTDEAFDLYNEALQALELYQKNHQGGYMQDTINSFKSQIVGYLSPKKVIEVDRMDRALEKGGTHEHVADTPVADESNGVRLIRDNTENIQATANEFQDNRTSNISPYETKFKEELYSPTTKPGYIPNNPNANIASVPFVAEFANLEVPSSPDVNSDPESPLHSATVEKQQSACATLKAKLLDLQRKRIGSAAFGNVRGADTVETDVSAKDTVEHTAKCTKNKNTAFIAGMLQNSTPISPNGSSKHAVVPVHVASIPPDYSKTRQIITSAALVKPDTDSKEKVVGIKKKTTTVSSTNKTTIKVGKHLKSSKMKEILKGTNEPDPVKRKSSKEKTNSVSKVTPKVSSKRITTNKSI